MIAKLILDIPVGSIILSSAMSETLLDHRQIFYRLGRLLWITSRLKSSLIFILLLLAGLIQGTGLLLILPFLQVLGVGMPASAASNTIIHHLIQGMKAVGLPFTLETALILFCLAVTAQAFLAYVQSMQQSQLVSRLACDLKTMHYRRILASDWPALARLQHGAIYNLLTQDINHTNQAAQEMLKLLVSAVFAAVYLGVAFYLSWFFSLLSLTVAALLFLLLYPVQKSVLFHSRQLRQGHQHWFKRLTDHLAFLKPIKSFSREEAALQDFARAAEELRRHQNLIQRLLALSPAVFSTAGAVFLAFFIYTGLRIFQVPPLELGLLIFIYARLLTRLAHLQQSTQALLQARPAISKVLDDKTSLAGPLPRLGPPSTPPPPVVLTDSIQLREVTYHHEKSRKAGVAHLNLRLPAHRITAITGPSGAGKTTLLDLLLGLLTPQQGEICLDGIPLDKIGASAWRHSVGYVPQEDALFEDSIRHNLLWAAPDRSEPEIYLALEQAAAADFVRQLPHQLDTKLGHRGALLSGGERQRLSLARALLRHPTVLILDEPTNSLDRKSEKAIGDSLVRLKEKCTIILVTHNAFMLGLADEVIHLENGACSRNERGAEPEIAPSTVRSG